MAHVPSWPTTWVVFQTPSAYAPEPPMSLTRSVRSLNPPSAAKNGTCVVPAWVMSGPSPETAALRMRSSWTPQSTTSTSTLMPVFSVNGFSDASMSSLGCGPLGMIHTRTVVPGLMSDLAALLLVLLLALVASSSPPHPEYTRAPTRTAAIDSRIAYLRTILLLLQKRFRYYAWHCVGNLFAAVTPYVSVRGRVEPRRTSST